MVITQTYAIHRQIERQFAKILRPVRAAEAKAAPPAGGRQSRLAALEQPAECRFVKTPLGEVASCFAKRHGIEVVVDETSLHDAGIATDVPVTAEVRGVRLAWAREPDSFPGGPDLDG